MDVVLVGNGGREHALAWRIAQSPSLGRLYCTGANPGFEGIATVRPAATPDAIAAVVRDVHADLVVVGPEAPLQAGVADVLAGIGVPCFGPTAAAARLETSKSFAKDVMAEAGVPAARGITVDPADAASWAAGVDRCARGDVVVKADGLAAGKGVIVCESPAEAHAALVRVRDAFGGAAARIVLEDRLTGPEVSLFALCDGERAVVLPAAQDHKRLADGERGPNTGGMGAYAPCRLVPEADAELLCDAVHRPVLRAMAARGTPFRGLLYAGLMLTPDGPRVLEFNARFGDPETQPLMALWDDDLVAWLYAAATGRLPAGRPRFRDGAACCVVLAAAGYPDAPVTGVPVPVGPVPPGGAVFYAGIARGAHGLVTAGGRVLGVTGVGPDLATARARAYDAVPGWRFAGAQLRHDIGAGATPAGSR